MIRRIQAAALLLLFMTATLFGQLNLHVCACSGDVALTPSEVDVCGPVEPAACHSCDHSERSHHGDDHDSPSCHGEDCCLLLPLPAVDSPLLFDANHAPIPPVPARDVSVVLAPDNTGTLDSRPWFTRPPDPPPAQLTVLYASFLI